MFLARAMKPRAAQAELTGNYHNANTRRNRKSEPLWKRLRLSSSSPLTFLIILVSLSLVLVLWVSMATRFSQDIVNLTPNEELNASKALFLRYNRTLHTGLGDRLTVMACVAALAEAAGANKVYVPWYFDETRPDFFLAYRLEVVKQYIQFPPNMIVLSFEDFNREARDALDIEFDTEGLVPSYFAFDGVYTIARRTMRLPSIFKPVNQREFEAAYRRISKGFRAMRMPDAYHQMPSFFVAVHIRGHDKPAAFDDFDTLDVLKKIPEHIHLEIMSDDVALRERIFKGLGRRREEMVCATVKDRVPRDLCDLGVFLKADAIVQHSREGWSAFSSFAAMIKGIPLLNTWIDAGDPQRHRRHVGLLSEFDNQYGGCPHELMNAQREDVSRAFIDDICDMARRTKY